MLDWYRFVMDPEKNPLRNLGPVQRFQIMTILSLAWTAIFCAAASAWLWYGEIVVVHLLLALGVLLTGYTFRAAAKAGADQPGQAQQWANGADTDRTA